MNNGSTYSYMMVGDRGRIEQWCLRVPAKEGEAVRQALVSKNMLDMTLRPRRDGGELLMPVVGWCEGAERCTFDPRPESTALPRHDMIGGIAVMQEYDPGGAARILVSRPNLHTVLLAKGEVTGEHRTREFEVLGGIPVTRTTVTEYGRTFAIDLSAAYFSPRLATERQRIAGLMGEGEIVLDMFAGVGPFAIALAGRAMLVVAADINPHAVTLMLENCTKNKTVNVLPVLTDARHLADIIPWQFDRIIMNLPKSAESFLPDAFRLCKPGGTIHFYALVSKGGEHQERIEKLGGKVIAERAVRSYSPAQWHAVYDILVK